MQRSPAVPGAAPKPAAPKTSDVIKLGWGKTEENGNRTLHITWKGGVIFIEVAPKAADALVAYAKEHQRTRNPMSDERLLVWYFETYLSPAYIKSNVIVKHLSNHHSGFRFEMGQVLARLEAAEKKQVEEQKKKSAAVRNQKDEKDETAKDPYKKSSPEKKAELRANLNKSDPNDLSPSLVPSALLDKIALGTPDNYDPSLPRPLSLSLPKEEGSPLTEPLSPPTPKSDWISRRTSSGQQRTASGERRKDSGAGMPRAPSFRSAAGAGTPQVARSGSGSERKIHRDPSPSDIPLSPDSQSQGSPASPVAPAPVAHEKKQRDSHSEALQALYAFASASLAPVPSAAASRSLGAEHVSAVPSPAPAPVASAWKDRLRKKKQKTSHAESSELSDVDLTPPQAFFAQATVAQSPARDEAPFSAAASSSSRKRGRR